MHQYLRPYTLLALLALGACSSDPDEQPATVTGIEPRPVPGCEDESYAACNVQSAACQEAIFSTVACLRGNAGASLPSARTITTDQFAAELIATDLAPSFSDEQLSAFERGMVLLHLLKDGDLTGSGYVESQKNTVPAYYDPDTDSITFVHQDGSESNEQRTAYTTLAHEYVHALQDQEHDLNLLGDQYATSTDASLALHALIEGEATVLEDAFLAAVWGLEDSKLDHDARYQHQETLAAERLKQYSPALAIQRSFPYHAGGPLVYRAYAAGGMAEVRKLYANPPTSTLEVRKGIRTVPVLADPPAPPSGYTLLMTDTLGSELFYDFIEATLVADGDTANFPYDWRGDRIYFYYQPGTANVAVLWRVKLASEAPRNQILSKASWQTRALEDDVLILRTNALDANALGATLFDNAIQGRTVSPDTQTDDLAQAARWVLRPRLLPRGWSRR